jgi:hypothetical protein
LQNTSLAVLLEKNENSLGEKVHSSSHLFIKDCAAMPILLLFLLIGMPLIHACLDLTPFITDATADNLKIVLAGGNLSSNLPLYFDVGRQQVSPNTPLTFCLNGLRIPTMVGSTLCNTLSTQQCFLAVGTKANDDGGSDLDYCASSDGDIAPCYSCLCQGLDWTTSASGADNETISDVCGFGSQTEWGTTCLETDNGRNDNDSFATVHITACPNISGVNDCTVCGSGGILPAFQVVVQWLSENCLTAGWPTSTAWRTSFIWSSFVGILFTSLIMM